MRSASADPAADSAADPAADPVRDRLARAIAACELPKYVYGYPPKRAYRAMDPSWTVARAWAGTSGPLNLYVHVPFCGYRCSFCTLFLTTSHTPELVERYVGALCRQIAMYGALLPEVEIVSLYLGGGTPTVLSPAQLQAVMQALHAAFARWHPDAEIGLEGSPDTMRPELLARAKALGINRISMGLQSLDPDEQRRVGRRYAPEAVDAAVAAIGAQRFDNVNYDLIYGLEGQTEQSWHGSLRKTIGFSPSTITLYPVVARPLTAIEKRMALRSERFASNAAKYARYDESVAVLREHGYRQNSFVRFSTCEHDGLRQEAADFAGVPLLGLGAGSRSYTDAFHYGTDFAVGRRESLDIIEAFVAHDPRPDDPVALGFPLVRDEQKRRFCILALCLGGVDAGRYRARFGDDLGSDFGPELAALAAEGLTVAQADGSHRLTPKGFKYSNVIGDLFQSPAVTELEARYVPR
jgi:oxygen-independent coproporphyrinogen-3 oxidase